MTSLWLYTVFIALTGAERLVEVRVSLRNAAWSFAQGGVEHGASHYPFMVVLHTGFLFACVGEAWLLERPFIGWLGWSMLAVALGCQILRWWCITSLGQRWNTRVIIVPGLARVTKGPYAWLPHPNYVAVVLEGVALPLIHTCWITAVGFSVLNAGLLWVRIGVEDQALAELEANPG